MCLIILKPAKGTVPEWTMRKAWAGNSDGAGFSFINPKDKKVVTMKGYMALKEFLESYKMMTEKYVKSPFLIHFRTRTLGDRNEANTHPFETPHGAMAHNGHMHGSGAVALVGKSDSHFFAERYGEELTQEIVETNKVTLSGILGYDKLAFLWHGGGYSIINETSGKWENEVWYSNTHWNTRNFEWQGQRGYD